MLPWLRFLFDRKRTASPKPDFAEEEAAQWEEQRWNRERLDRFDDNDTDTEPEPTALDCPDSPDEFDMPH